MNGVFQVAGSVIVTHRRSHGSVNPVILVVYTSRDQEYPFQGAHLFADGCVVKT